MNMLAIVGIISNEHERKQKKKWAWRCFLYGIVMIAISAGINLIFD